MSWIRTSVKTVRCETNYVSDLFWIVSTIDDKKIKYKSIKKKYNFVHVGNTVSLYSARIASTYIIARKEHIAYPWQAFPRHAHLIGEKDGLIKEVY